MTESHFRSIIKGISWRLVGTFDTILISFLLTGHITLAFKIGFTELFTKVALYYLHERAWLYFLHEKDQSPRISAFKAITWRILGTIDTSILAWIYSGNPWIGLKIGMVEVVTKFALYYLHERLWHRVPLGTVRRWFGIGKK